MKYVILLALVAFAYAVPTGVPYGPTTTKNVNINEDGTITITTPAGKKVVISRAIGVDSKYIDISVEGPNTPTKRIQIDALSGDKTVEIANTYDSVEDRDKRSPKIAKTKAKTTSDVLAEVFEEYQGAVDEKSFGKLLDKVQAYVAAGDIDAEIEDALRYLHEKKVVAQQQGITPEFKQLLDYWVQDAIRRQVGPQYQQTYPEGQQGIVTDKSAIVQQPTESALLQQLAPLRLQASSKQATPQSSVATQSQVPLSQPSVSSTRASTPIPPEVQQIRFVQYQQQLLKNQIEQNKLAGNDALVAQQNQQLTQLQQQEKDLQQQLIANRFLFYRPYYPGYPMYPMYL